MRKLASIQRVSAVDPIEGADAIEKVRILGWNVVIKKEEFNVGDLVVYMEIDSVLPERPEFEFLRHKDFRIRTIRLRGQVSQGICFPVSILPEVDQNGEPYFVSEGEDVTELLGVVKHEPQIHAKLRGIAKGNFPNYIPKTDETRVQLLEHVLDRHKGRLFYRAEKLDGSSVTIYLNDEFGVCSRNLDLVETEGSLFWQTVRNLGIENKLRAYSNIRGGKSFSLQGELVGPNVQKNKLKLKENTIYFFNMLDNSEGRFLSLDELESALREMELNIVPMLERNISLDHSIDRIVEIATHKSALNPAVDAEGDVWRPMIECNDYDLGRLSFKAINPKFLLKFQDD